uniref:(California timema) hypothetical protein n=1 Tax=Timema californicum TaxID=61474 RepID=A0A7R9J4V2_TIMCA|nr:unnamed protein product [Timema californicum]
MYLNAALQILKQSMSRKSPLFSLIGRSPSLVSSCKLGTRSQGDDPPNRHSPEGVSSGRSSSSQSDPDDKATEPQRVVPLMEARRFFVDVLTSSSVNDNYAQQMADALLFADYNGIYSHGLSRLGMYVNDLESGAMDGNACPVLLRESPSTGWVDGQNGPGVVIGNFCMQLAIQKAKEEGVGLVSAKRSNNVHRFQSFRGEQLVYHAGQEGESIVVSAHDYELRDPGLHSRLVPWSLCLTNTSPLTAPPGSREAALGTNPIGFGAPAKNCDGVSVDISTSAGSLGQIEQHVLTKRPLPENWAQDLEGSPTTDPQVALKAMCLMPFGGPESSYKGYALATMVEALCSILADSMYGPYVRQRRDGPGESNLGQCFVAINPELFAPGFKDRLSNLLESLRDLEPAELAARTSVEPLKLIIKPNEEPKLTQ